MEPVAITGFSFRFPQGAEDEASFWDMLENGRNVMTEWPESRANVDAFYHQRSTMNNTVSMPRLPSRMVERTKTDTANSYLLEERTSSREIQRPLMPPFSPLHQRVSNN